MAGGAYVAMGRLMYTDMVAQLPGFVNLMEESGYAINEIADTVSGMRLGIRSFLQDITPSGLADNIAARNTMRYGNPIGPTSNSLRSQGFSDQQIIEKAVRTGGKDLGL